MYRCVYASSLLSIPDSAFIALIIMRNFGIIIYKGETI